MLEVSLSILKISYKTFLEGIKSYVSAGGDLIKNIKIVDLGVEKRKGFMFIFDCHRSTFNVKFNSWNSIDEIEIQDDMIFFDMISSISKDFERIIRLVKFEVSVMEARDLNIFLKTSGDDFDLSASAQDLLAV